jgi:hypothetical protein
MLQLGDGAAAAALSIGMVKASAWWRLGDGAAAALSIGTVAALPLCNLLKQGLLAEDCSLPFFGRITGRPAGGVCLCCIYNSSFVIAACVAHVLEERDKSVDVLVPIALLSGRDGGSVFIVRLNLSA